MSMGIIKNESINQSGDKENPHEMTRIDKTRAIVSKKLDKSKMNVSNFIPIEKVEYNKKKVEEVVEAKEERRVQEEEKRVAMLAEAGKKKDEDEGNAFTGFFKNMFMFCGNDDKKDDGGCFGERAA